MYSHLQKIRMVDLYLHTHICPNGVVIKCLSPGITLPLLHASPETLTTLQIERQFCDLMF
jgi:hypothetical protein